MLGRLHRCLISLNQIAKSSQKIYMHNALEQLPLTNSSCILHRKYSISTESENILTANEEDPDFEGETDPFLRTEIKKFNIGKRWLARMMGEDAETFTQKDIDEAIQYLLPSHLWAKDARPCMKHPYELFPKAKASKFDEHGRPTSSAFYTGKPKFHDLTFEIWDHLERFDNPDMKREAIDSNKDVSGQSDINSSEELTAPKVMQWMKKFQLEQKLNEPMSDKQYEVIIFRLKKLANHKFASEIQDFLQQFQVPVHISGKEDLKEVDVYDGAARAMGYRKTAIAEVIVREGSGTISVNTKPLLDYFPLSNDREQIMFPLLVVDELDRFDIEAHVIGGGSSGKSGAIRLGISRAIAALCPQYFDALDKTGLLIQDCRVKERKKPGRKKARRAFQWVKR